MAWLGLRLAHLNHPPIQKPGRRFFLSALVVLINHVHSLSGWLSGESFPFGVTSLVDKRDYLQAGDAVKFQVGINYHLSNEGMKPGATFDVDGYWILGLRMKASFIG